MKFPELMFYAESEGLLPTRAGKINAVIAAINEYPFTLTLDEFKEFLEDYGLRYEDLSSRELKYIKASIR